MQHTILKNQVQLITYPDSLGGNLAELTRVLETYVGDAIGGVHVLPFYPSSADRGFCPLTHLEVDPAFGTWEDMRALAARYDLIADLIVNHISSESLYFKDVQSKGEASEYASLFLDVDTYLRRNNTDDQALAATYRPRPTPPYTEYQYADGSTHRLWTTFTSQQIDLDFTHEATRALIRSFITKLTENGVRLLRLDAAGYIVKKPWTASFLIPETFELMRSLKDEVPAGTEVLAEVHDVYQVQQQLITEHVTDWVYDFALPILTLHAIYSADARNLKNWITIRPTNAITTLDTHDGIGVGDAKGLMTDDEAAYTIAEIHRHGGNDSMRASGTNAENLDIYQTNTTYYSALNENDDAYLTARAIQFFIPGIPQVYYVGLFAGKNDMALLERTNHGRDINRHNYTAEEIEQEVQRPVVQRLLALMRFRNTHPAFNGTFTLLPSDTHTLNLKWELDHSMCTAHIDLTTQKVVIDYTNPANGNTIEQLAV